MMIPPAVVPADGDSFKTTNPIMVASNGVTNIKLVTSLVFLAISKAFPQVNAAMALGKTPRYMTTKIWESGALDISWIPFGKNGRNKIAPAVILNMVISKGVYPWESSFLWYRLYPQKSMAVLRVQRIPTFMESTPSHKVRTRIPMNSIPMEIQPMAGIFSR